MSDSDVKEPAIRELAHELWQRSGCPTGDEDHFWYEAERVLKAATTPAAAKNPDGDRLQKQPASS